MDDVAFVVDTGRMKENRFDPAKRMASLDDCLVLRRMSVTIAAKTKILTIIMIILTQDMMMMKMMIVHFVLLLYSVVSFLTLPHVTQRCTT